MSQITLSDLRKNVKVDDGTVSAPSITFRGDSNNGLYRPAEDTLSVVTNGIERMRIDGNGTIAFTGFLNAQVPACFIRSTTAQTIPAWGNSVKVDYNASPVINRNNLFNTTNKRIQPPVNGIYYIFASYTVQRNTEARYVYISISKNVTSPTLVADTIEDDTKKLGFGSTSIGTPSGFAYPTIQATCIAELTTADYVEVFGSSDGTTTKYTGADNGNLFMAYLITAI